MGTLTAHRIRAIFDPDGTVQAPRDQLRTSVDVLRVATFRSDRPSSTCSGSSDQGTWMSVPRCVDRGQAWPGLYQLGDGECGELGRTGRRSARGGESFRNVDVVAIGVSGLSLSLGPSACTS